MKTRTKDKYRVVYTDHQRLELEKEFHYSRYITIRRKAELAATLGLSERQVGITFLGSGYYGLGRSSWVALENPPGPGSRRLLRALGVSVVFPALSVLSISMDLESGKGKAKSMLPPPPLRWDFTWPG